MASKHSPQWRVLYDEIKRLGDTVACEIHPNGERSFFMPKSGYSVDGRSLKAMLKRDMLRPCGIQIDPENPQSWEPV